MLEVASGATGPPPTLARYVVCIEMLWRSRYRTRLGCGIASYRVRKQVPLV